MTVPFLSVQPKAIKLKVSPRFPAQLLGGTAIDVSKANGNYTVDLDYSELPQVGAVPSGTFAAVFDPVHQTYVLVPTSTLGGGLSDAPSDGSAYGRLNGAWTQVLPLAGGTLTGPVTFNIARSISTAQSLDDIAVAPATTTITGSGTVAQLNKVNVHAPTYTAAGAVTITDAATVFIEGAPIAGGAVTFTRPWAEEIRSGALWLRGNGTYDGRLMIGEFVPPDWPVDAVVVSSMLTGFGSVAINSAPFLGTPAVVTPNRTAYGFATQAQTNPGVAWDLWVAGSFRTMFFGSGSTIDKQYAIHASPMSGATTVNQAGWIEGKDVTGRFGFGTDKAQAQVVVNANAKTDLALPALTQLGLVPADGTGNAMSFFGIGGNFTQGQFVGVKMRGTAAAPSAVTAGDFLFSIFAEGYDGTATFGVGAQVQFIATSGSGWSSTSHGCDIAINTTPDNTVSTAETIRLRGSHGVSVNGASDPGAGNVSTTGGFVPGSFTVATLPAGATGKMVYCSNARMFNGAGVQQGAGAGTGGLVFYNGAWKNCDAGSVTAIA